MRSLPDCKIDLCAFRFIISLFPLYSRMCSIFCSATRRGCFREMVNTYTLCGARGYVGWIARVGRRTVVTVMSSCCASRMRMNSSHHPPFWPTFSFEQRESATASQNSISLVGLASKDSSFA